MYSVRNAYIICMKEIVDNTHLHKSGCWDLIWNIKVSPKIKKKKKKPSWHVCKGCILTQARLSSKCVSCPNACVICGNNYEDDIHVLFEYSSALQV